MNPWHCLVSFISKSVRQHAGLHAWLCSHTTHRTMCSCTLFWRGSRLLALLLGVLYSRYRNSPTDVGDDGSWSHPIQAYICVSLPPTQPTNLPKALFAFLIITRVAVTFVLAERLGDWRWIQGSGPRWEGERSGKRSSWKEMRRDSIQGTSFHYSNKEVQRHRIFFFMICLPCISV